MADTRDPEIQAMGALSGALEPLDNDTRKRVLGWAEERFVGSILQMRIERDKEAQEGFSEAGEAFSRFYQEVIARFQELGNRSPLELFKAIDMILEQADSLGQKKRAVRRED